MANPSLKQLSINKNCHPESKDLRLSHHKTVILSEARSAKSKSLS